MQGIEACIKLSVLWKIGIFVINILNLRLIMIVHGFQERLNTGNVVVLLLLL